MDTRGLEGGGGEGADVSDEELRAMDGIGIDSGGLDSSHGVNAVVRG